MARKNGSCRPLQLYKSLFYNCRFDVLYLLENSLQFFGVNQKNLQRDPNTWHPCHLTCMSRGRNLVSGQYGQWRSQPDNLVMLCKFHIIIIFISLEIDCFHGLWTRKYLHSMTKLSGWLRHWIRGFHQSMQAPFHLWDHVFDSRCEHMIIMCIAHRKRPRLYITSFTFSVC